MPFEPIANFMFQAAKEHNLDKQAIAGIICKKAREVIAQDFTDFQEFWDVKKIQNKTLTIQTSNSTAGSVLFMNKLNLIKAINQTDIPHKILDIKIIRN